MLNDRQAQMRSYKIGSQLQVIKMYISIQSYRHLTLQNPSTSVDYKRYGEILLAPQWYVYT